MSLKSARALPMVSNAWSKAGVPVCCKSTTVEHASEMMVDYDKAKPFADIPGPKGLPWFGSWLKYKLNPSLISRRDMLVRDLYSKYGGIVKEVVAGHVSIHLFEPEFIQQVYKAEGKYPVIPALLEPVQFHREKNDLVPGLGNSNGEEWYRLRAIVQHMTVRPQSAQEYLSDEEEVADDFLNVLDTLIGENGEVPGINDWISRWGLESAAKTFLDRRLGYFSDKEGIAAADRVIQAGDAVFNASTKLWFALPLYRHFATPTRNELFANEDYGNQSSNDLLIIALKEIESAIKAGNLPEDRYKFLRYLLSKDLSEQDMSALARSVLKDTLSTTAQSVMACLYTLAANPEAQEKAREEANAILGSNGEFTKQSFQAASYTKAFIKETLRFLPVGLDVQRYTETDLVIGGYQIPKGTYIRLTPFGAQHSPKHVEKPEVFVPERWLRGGHSEYRVKRHPYLMNPFSIGTRTCAGRRFAEQELVMMISKILRRYRLEWHHGPLHQRFRLLQVFDDEVKVTFIRRQ